MPARVIRQNRRARRGIIAAFVLSFVNLVATYLAFRQPVRLAPVVQPAVHRTLRTDRAELRRPAGKEYVLPGLSIAGIVLQVASNIPIFPQSSCFRLRSCSGRSSAPRRRWWRGPPHSPPLVG